MELPGRVLSVGLASYLATGGAWAAQPPAAAAGAGVGIEHKAVGCIVAEEYPRLEACFAPSELLGRAQVQFRGSTKSLWYAVDMKSDGPCFTAWLPKPKKETTSIEYFVLALDKQFAESQRPETAPSQPYTPRVVPKKGDCEELKAFAAWSSKTAPRILVSAVRDAGGKVLSAGAAAGQTAPGGLAGFSSDGVVVANESTTSSPSASKTGGSGGHHLGALAVVGGLVVAGGVVALAAGGGGGSGGSGSSGSGSSSPSTPATTLPPSNPLSGVWTATGSSGYNIRLVFDRNQGECHWDSDVSVNFTQNGNTLTGPAVLNTKPVACSPGRLVNNAREFAPPPSDTFVATLTPPNGISMSTSWVPISGSYSSTKISMKGSQNLSGIGVMEITMTLRKQGVSP